MDFNGQCAVLINRQSLDCTKELTKYHLRCGCLGCLALSYFTNAMNKLSENARVKQDAVVLRQRVHRRREQAR